MASDDGATLSRLRTLTEKGTSRYLALRDQHIENINSAYGNICTEIAKIQLQQGSLSALQEIKNNISVYVTRYDTLTEGFLDFLHRTNTVQSLGDRATFARTSEEQKAKIDEALARLQDYTTKLLHEDASSVMSSNVSSAASRKRAKAEAAKARLEFAKQEVELKRRQALLDQESAIAAAHAAKQKADLEAELGLLTQAKELAAAEAEADALSGREDSNRSMKNSVLSRLPAQSGEEKVAAYVNHHMHTADVDARDPAVVIDTQPRRKTSPESQNHNLALNPNAPAFAPDWASLYLKKELLLNRMCVFNDRPESYAAWKDTFRSIANDLHLSPMEELDLMIKWLGPDSKQQAISIKTSNARNPKKGLDRAWERLDERFGAPELVESSLKQKLASFPKLTNKDIGKLYELTDILSEVEALKEDPQYSLLLSYYDTSAGINPIVKLPGSLQEKWTTRAVRYNAQHGMYFPPFVVFIDFIRDISKTRNNPSFMYDVSTPQTTKKEKSGSDKRNISVRKTEVSDKQSTPSKKATDTCPIHNTKHTLNECRGFRSKPLPERKQLLKKIGFCFKCCGPDHMIKDCEATIRCDCGSDRHPTALHVDGEESGQGDSKPVVSGKDRPVNSKCTQVCGNGLPSKSCAKILLVNVFHEKHPEATCKVYAIVDDQSNRSLAKPDLFDLLNIYGEETEYTLTSCNGKVKTSGRRADGLVVESLDKTTRLKLPVLIECSQIPDEKEEIPVPEVARHFTHLRDIEAAIPPLDQEAKILLLIGRDLIEAHHVLDQRVGIGSVPYAQKLSLRWTIIGESCLGTVHRPDRIVTNKTHVLGNSRPSILTPCPNIFEAKENPNTQCTSATLPTDAIGRTVFERTRDDDKPGTSVEDRDFLRLMNSDFTNDEDGRWLAPLPFRSGRPRLSNNRAQAFKRARTLTSSLRRDTRKRQHFLTFMKGIFDAGHAEIAPPLKQNEECWYLPIFGVYHPPKPDQIRGVFDSSAKHDGISLNDVLLTGPDLTNSLLGILLRFRQESVAVMADIQQMFYCFKVKQEHRNYLRFLWFRNNNPEEDLVEYHMCVHVFGNSPSPAVATYGLRQSALGGEEVFGTDVKDFVTNNFYVDDGLVSLPTSDKAVSLIKRTQQALLSGGKLRLHKIASNSNEVMTAFPAEDLAKNLKDLDFSKDNVPAQRSLGVIWDIKSDTFTFRKSSKDKPFTRRGVLSTVNSLYDPVGFMAPVTVQGKLFLRELLSQNTDWDAPLPEESHSRWQQWKDSLWAIDDLQVPRSYCPGSSPTDMTAKELHIFADASEKAIAAVSFIKLATPNNQHVSFALGKAKVAPTHAITMPRLELCAALLAAEIGKVLQDNLDLTFDSVTYYSDSKVVLGYLTNRVRRFYIYVANRIQRILQLTRPDQWTYVPTHLNPADLGTRTVRADQLENSSWLKGPDFLCSPDCPPPTSIPRKASSLSLTTMSKCVPQ